MYTYSCASERYNAHRDLERLLHNDEGRIYHWRHNGDHALVRLKDDDVEVPMIGEKIDFEYDGVPMRTRGARPGRSKRRLYLTDKNEQQLWVRKLLLDHAGLAIENVKSQSLDLSVRDFFKPGYRFWGSAFVVMPDRLEHALRNGVGDAKAYGYGMLII